MNRLNDVLKNVNQMAAMPMVVSKLASVVADSESSINDITRIISYDQSLTANVIRWANSAAWARQRTIVDIKEAVIRIGPGRILNIIVGNHVKPSMDSSCEEYGFQSGELWKHAVASSLAAEELNKLISLSLPSETFTAALLHDIGKLVIKQSIDSSILDDIFGSIKTDGLAYIEAEHKILGFDHAEAGCEIAKLWKFPEAIAESILYHHNPDKREDIMTDAVHISNLAAKSIGIGLGNEAMNLYGSVNAAKRLGLRSSRFEKLCIAVIEKLPEIEELFRV